MDKLTGLLTRPFWAIRPEAYTELLRLSKAEALTLIIEPEKRRLAVFSEAFNARQSQLSDKTMVIPVEGTLTKDSSWAGTSYDSISRALDTAASDSTIGRVVLLLDSPGGEVTGLPEVADQVSQLAKVKPVHAMVNGMAASAAYWLASQASDISLTPSGEVGSVGVRMMHADISQMLANEGIKITEIFSGNHKTEGSPFTPLSEETRTYMQGQLDQLHGQFMAAVASGRGARVTSEMSGNRYGEGRMFYAADALDSGLVDRVTNQRDFFKQIQPAQELSAIKPPRAENEALRKRLDLEAKRFS